MDYRLQAIWHQHSNKLSQWLLDVIPRHSSVIDIGAGHNFYVDLFKSINHTEDARGLDYFEWPSSNLISNVDFIQDDPEAIFTFECGATHFDVALSFEVGEHIPPEHTEKFLDWLCVADRLIISWAIVGQQGIGHVNCLSNEDVIRKIEKRGYTHNQELTNEARQAVKGCHCNWFEKSLMVFDFK